MARSIVLKDTPINVGDSIKIHYAVKDKDKKKSQLFEGIVLAIKGRESNKMVTVRKLTRSNIGVERIFPAISPFIEQVEVVKISSTTRANVSYIRDKSKKEIKDKLYR